MITEDYVSFETAKLLKEKGFNPLECGMYYSITTGKRTTELLTSLITCPTLQMAMKWLREVHNIIPIILTGDNRHDGVIIYYWFRIDTIKNGRLKDAVYREDEIEYPTYEKACEAAIKYTLKNLI